VPDCNQAHPDHPIHWLSVSGRDSSPNPRVKIRQKTMTYCREGAYTKDSCGFARASDLCQASIGESYSVSWRW
jgi:hypothetical protein